MNDDAVFDLYNRTLMTLARGAEGSARLPGAAFSARAVSPVCGSEVTLDFTIVDGRVSSVGYAVDACALTRAVVAVLKIAAIGKTPAEVLAAGQHLAIMLDGGNAPDGDWGDLAVLLPVRDYKARHDSVLLPFMAAEKAFKNSVA